MALTISQALDQAKKQISERIKKETSGVLSAFHDEQGWHIKLEMLERRTFPPLLDVLVIYGILLDEEGNLVKIEQDDFRRRGLPIIYKST